MPVDAQHGHILNNRGPVVQHGHILNKRSLLCTTPHATHLHSTGRVDGWAMPWRALMWATKISSFLCIEQISKCLSCALHIQRASLPVHDPHHERLHCCLIQTA